VLDQAQAAYDQVAGQADIGMLPQSVALQQATAAFRAAQAEYGAVQRGATSQELAVAQAQVDAARAQAAVTASGIAAAEAQVAIAEAAVAQAQAQLDLLRAGPRAVDVAAARAAVAQAQAGLDGARSALGKAQLVAPFAGTVAAVWARPGEIVSPGQQVLALGDLSAYQVETTDLRETDVARVAMGQPVEVTFDALPNQSFAGRIVRIAPMATQAQGSVNYTAIVELDELDPAVRWGMTAFVNIVSR
jgi:multidrug resistance efflux pump